ncbi:Translation machinery-associated protein 22 [Talaromyces atroroseus]|uniref:Translation machinery-associated protein 22 n=1 Tax=Talaromyces atroroseus TaxID=1441469 RepID=A0A225AC91_TALAT|nr:Translation machinery-associated protein 22 [Talaromyces atroroseus]OKL58692.1 Translation machinery-associated protein 22 [Talaromyces atroroseus]
MQINQNDINIDTTDILLNAKGKKKMAEVADQPVEPRARHVVYCGVCTLPPEYCEFGGTSKKCEEWLETSHPDLHQRLYSEETINANLSTLSISARERAAKDAAKKEAKAQQALERETERKASSKIQIKRVERNKRKFVTVVIGLEAHGLDLKKVAKELGKKFATGSSVTKSPSGTEEITVQGDVSDDLFEWLLEVHGDKVPEDNVELVEDKKKKAAT